MLSKPSLARVCHGEDLGYAVARPATFLMCSGDTGVGAVLIASRGPSATAEDCVAPELRIAPGTGPWNRGESGPRAPSGSRLSGTGTLRREPTRTRCEPALHIPGTGRGRGADGQVGVDESLGIDAEPWLGME